MTNITKLPSGVERRKCPGCGYIEAQMLIDAARYNFRCVRCGKYKLSDFVSDTDPEPPKPEKSRTVERHQAELEVTK